MVTAQEMIYEAFEGRFLTLSEVAPKLSKKDRTQLCTTEKNSDEPCAMCGQIHAKGYTSNMGAAHMMKSLIPNSFNECYAFEQSNFICQFCGFSLVSYGSPEKMALGKRMVNVLIDKGKDGMRRTQMSFLSNDTNQLYDILTNPPASPFVILINSRGKVLENLVFNARPTISRSVITVNYGITPLRVRPQKVFDLIDEVRSLADQYGFRTEADFIYNRMNDVAFRPPKKVTENPEAMAAISRVIGEYDRDTRVVAKMVLARYLKEHKTAVPKRSKQPSGSTPEQLQLF